MSDPVKDNPARKVLVVEDDFNMRNMLALFLEKKGFEVGAATDAVDGLKQIEKNDYPLIITDIRMPGGNGIDILKAAKKRNPYTEVIVMTAYATVENVLEAMKIGAYEYILKPIDDLERDVLRILERALERRELARQNQDLLIKMARLTKELQKKNEELLAERKLAGHIQTSILPPLDYSFPGVEIGAKRICAEEVSGDFHDFIMLPQGLLGVLIGQAFGRDLPAGLLMAMVSGRIRQLAYQIADPAEVLRQTNESIRLCLDRGYGNFVSAFYGIFDFKKHEFVFSSADHVPPLFIHYRGLSETLPLKTGGSFLGKYSQAKFESKRLRLRHGDRLALCTERLLTVVNGENEPFGSERLAKLLLATGEGNPRRTVETVVDTVRRFSVNGLSGVDLTFILIDYP